MEEREKKRKILYIVLGVIALILIFFMIRSCTSNKDPKDNPNSITKIDLASSSMVLEVGDEEKLSYTILPTTSDEITKWLTSDSSVVSVDSRGNIRARKTGVATITLVSEGGVFDSTEVKVVSKLNGDGTFVTANLIEKDINLKVGSTKKLSYELDPADAKYVEVMWESSNQLVATVTSDGNVTGLKSGVTSITVKIILGDNTVITDTATVTVEENASLYLTSTVPDVRVGEVIRLSAALSTTDVAMTEGVVKSSNDNVITVSNVSTDSGYLMFDVKGMKAGNATLKLTAITSDGKTLNLDVPVTVVKFTDLYISSGNKELKIGNSFILSGRLEPIISGSLDTECKSSNEKNVTVSNVDPSGEYNGACQITAIKKGTATITMTISGQKQSIKVTVVENPSNPDNPDNPDNPNNPDNPDNPNNPDNPDNPDNPIGTASLSVTLDKTTYSINDKAVITVTFTDENGKVKNLSESEYTIATEFDSSSLGTKRLVVVYPYKDSSLKAEASYTISGGSSDPALTLPPGSGGYSSGGGGGGVKKATYSFEITKSNQVDASGSYKGGINVKFHENAKKAKKEWQYKFIVYTCILEDQSKCGSGPSREAGNEYGDSTWIPTEIHALYGSELNKEFTIHSYGDNRKVALIGYRDDCDEDKCLDVKYISKDDPNFDKYLRDAVSNNLYAGYDFEGNTIVDSKLGEQSNDNASESEAGSISIRPINEYKQSGASAEFMVVAQAKTGYQVLSIKSTDLGINETINDTQGSKMGSSTKNTVTATADFKNIKTGEITSLSVTVEVKIDDTAPELVCTYDKEGLAIQCLAFDAESGIASLTGTTGDDVLPIMDDPDYKQYNFVVTKAGTYSFTAVNGAGGKTTKTVTVDNYTCSKMAVCGEKFNAGTCNSCQNAGCKNPNEKPYYAYTCTSADKKDKFNYYVEALTNDYDDGSEFSVDLGYQYAEAEDIKIKENGKNYTCVPNKLKNKKVLTCGTVSSNGRVFTEGSGFAKNCRICGCDGWKVLIPNYTYNRNGIKNMYSTSDSEGITAIKFQTFTQTNCSGAKDGKPWFDVGVGGSLSAVQQLLGVD